MMGGEIRDEYKLLRPYGSMTMQEHTQHTRVGVGERVHQRIWILLDVEGKEG